VLAVLVWVALDAQPWAPRIWATLLLVPLPVAAAYQLRLVENPESLPRMPLYVSSAVSLWLLALVTAGVVWVSPLDWSALRFVRGPLGPTAAWSVGITAAGVALLGLARSLGIRESPILRRLLPATRREKLAFSGLSLTAGFCEELVFRGFLIAVMLDAWGSAILAVALSSVAFGWMHAYQDVAGAARAALLGVLLALPVVLFGSVVPSMIAHTAIDIVGGILLQKRLAPVE